MLKKWKEIAFFVVQVVLVLTLQTTLSLLRRHSIQNIEQDWKLRVKDTETQKTKTQKDENLVFPKEKV